MLDRIIGNVTVFTLFVSGSVFALLHVFQVILPIPHSTLVEEIFGVDYAVEQISADPKSAMLVLVLFWLFWLVWSLPLLFYRATKNNRFKYLAMLFLVSPIALDLIWAYELEWGGDYQFDGFLNISLIKHIVFGFFGYILAIQFLRYKANKLSQQDAASGAAA